MERKEQSEKSILQNINVGGQYLVTKNVGPNLMPFETAHLTLLKVRDFGTSGNPCSIWKLTYK
jgi:hypothetical protein